MKRFNLSEFARSGHLCVASPKQELVVMCRNELISPGTHQLLLLEKKILRQQRLGFSSSDACLVVAAQSGSGSTIYSLVRKPADDTSGDHFRPREPLRRAMERLKEALNVSNNFMRCRLGQMARDQGMGFHATEASCFLTADLFYLEVALLPCGRVEDVNMAWRGGSPVRSEQLLQLLRTKNFPVFSVKLADLFSLYNIQGEKTIKFKVFESLQHLSQDLQQMSRLPSLQLDPEAKEDVINNGVIGCLTAAKEDRPLSIQFFSVPAPATSTSASFVQGAEVTVSTSDGTTELQMASLLPQPARLDESGHPMFLTLSEVPHQTLPARFLLRLQPPMPLLVSFITKMTRITGDAIPDFDHERAPLYTLLASGGAKSHKEDEKDAVFSVHLDAAETQAYIFPRAAWDVPVHRATMVDHIPFSHPAHIPALVTVLRHQSTINALLRSCLATAASECPLSDLYELLPESETSFSVTFEHADSLAVLLVNITSSHQISCKLFGAGVEDPTLVGKLSAVLKRSMSVPLMLRTFHS